MSRHRAIVLFVSIVMLGHVQPAFARKQYMDAFKAKYPKVVAAEKVTCAMCHPARSKKVRNEFGKDLAKLVAKKEKDKDAIAAAFDKLAEQKSPIEGKSYGDLLNAGMMPDGFVSIFDGKTLDGWDGNTKLWTVEDKAITGTTSDENPIPANTFIIWRKGKVANFEMTFQYKIIKGNSGVQYRSFEMPETKWKVGGYQADFEAGKTYSGILYGEQFRGILAKRGEKTELIREGDKLVKKVVGTVGKSEEIQAKIKNEDWNDYHISAKGFRFIHKINGVITCDCTDNDEKMRRKDGILAFQVHKGPAMKVQFRNIRLKVLPDTPAKKDAAKKDAAE